MGNSYCQTPCEPDHDISHAQTAAYSQCRPVHIKPSQPIKVTGPIQTDDDIEPMITTNRKQRTKVQRVSEKRRHLSFAEMQHRKKRLPEESVEHRLTSALKGLSNSYSAGHLKSCSENQQHHSRHSSTKKVAFKQPVTAANPPNNKLENFLKKQRDFVEKRKRSIEKIRKLLEIQQQKENPHKPKLNIPSTTKSKNRKHILQQTITSAMLERSMNSCEDSKSRIRNPYNLSESVGSCLGSKLRQVRKELASEEQSKKLLEDLQSEMNRMLIGLDESITFQLFIGLMKSVNMVSEHTHQHDSFLSERQLLHQAWRMLTHSSTLEEECSQHDLAQFLSGLYGYELDESCTLIKLDQYKFEQAKHRYGLFRTNRDRPPDIVCQDYTKQNCNSPVNCQVIDTAPIMTRSCQPNPTLTINTKSAGCSNQLKIKKKQNYANPRIQTPQATGQFIYEKFNTFNPKSMESKTSQNLDTLVSRKTVQYNCQCRLEIDVDLGDRTETIKVSHDDDPEKIADCFLKFHALPAMLQPKLAALVREGLQRVNSQH